MSQWRGYGDHGGYAIVFSHSRLKRLVQKEARKWEWSFLFSGKVIYSSSTNRAIRYKFRKQISRMQSSWTKALRTHNHNDLGKNLALDFISCACLYKHGGFSEEKEFRFVFIPRSPKLMSMKKKKGINVSAAKPVYSVSKNEMTVPHLNIFEGITGGSTKLPIKRIIVGPHPEKEKRKAAVEQMLRQRGIQARVSVSAIPYLP